MAEDIPESARQLFILNILIFVLFFFLLPKCINLCFYTQLWVSFGTSFKTHFWIQEESNTFLITVIQLFIFLQYMFVVWLY